MYSILVAAGLHHTSERELCYLLGITKNDIVKSRRDFILHRKCHGFGANRDYYARFNVNRILIVRQLLNVYDLSIVCYFIGINAINEIFTVAFNLNIL